MNEIDEAVQQWLDDLAAFVPDEDAYDGPLPVTAFQGGDDETE